MTFLNLIASLFYLQSSLLFTYAPTQIVLLSVFLKIYKRYSWGHAIWLALSSQLASFFIIFLIGVATVPKIQVSILQFFKLAQMHIVLLIVGSFAIHVLCIQFFLRYVLKERGLVRYVLVSNAISALSVIGLYHILWR